MRTTKLTLWPDTDHLTQAYFIQWVRPFKLRAQCWLLMQVSPISSFGPCSLRLKLCGEVGAVCCPSCPQQWARTRLFSASQKLIPRCAVGLAGNSLEPKSSPIVEGSRLIRSPWLTHILYVLIALVSDSTVWHCCRAFSSCAEPAARTYLPAKWAANGGVWSALHPRPLS